jgi:hypothetical protein
MNWQAAPAENVLRAMLDSGRRRFFSGADFDFIVEDGSVRYSIKV